MQHDFKLVDGTFSPTEAGKVIIPLIQSKLQYHNLDDLSNFVLNDRDFSHSERRTRELREELEAFRQLIQASKASGKVMKISCRIEVELQEEPEAVLNREM